MPRWGDKVSAESYGRRAPCLTGVEVLSGCRVATLACLTARPSLDAGE
jgi:hypothetical protein